MVIKYVKFAEKNSALHMEEFHKDALKYHNSLQPKRS